MISFRNSLILKPGLILLILITFANPEVYSEDIDQRLDFRERPYYWIKGDYLGCDNEAGTDCHALENNKISFTSLNFCIKSSLILSGLISA